MNKPILCSVPYPINSSLNFLEALPGEKRTYPISANVQNENNHVFL